MHNLDEINTPLVNIIKKDDTGDIVTLMDETVHDSFVDYFNQIGIRAVILGEEGVSEVEDPEFAILLDEIEGTQNAINALPHGINIAIAKYKPRLIGKDLEAAVVANLYDRRVFVGERGRGAYIIDNGKKRNLKKKKTDLSEVPSPYAYTTEISQRTKQEWLTQLFDWHFGNQLRSIDSTGTRLVEVADSNLRAYGDHRNVTKCWDVLASALVLEEAGCIITDLLGFSLSDAIFYDINNPDYSRDGGLNRRVGENIIAANKEDHDLIVYGKNAKPRYRECTWDFNKIGRSINIDESNTLEDVGEFKAKRLVRIIKSKLEIYGNLSAESIRKLIEFFRKRYVEVNYPIMILKIHFALEFSNQDYIDFHKHIKRELPEKFKGHLRAFDEYMERAISMDNGLISINDI